MALSSAERARRYREKMKNDPERTQKYIKKERERKKKSYVPVAERTDRSQRTKRRQWKKASQSYRDKQRCPPFPATPPTTPTIPAAPVNQQRGRKKVRKDRSKAYRLIANLKVQVSRKETLVEKWKKRFHREKEAAMNKSQSPRSKVRRVLSNLNKTKGLNKQLIFNQVIVDELRKKYRENSDARLKRNIRRIAASTVIKKYKMMSFVSRDIGISRRLLKEDQRKGLLERKTRSDNVGKSVKEMIVNFFERDDNSRMMPGKKDTITRRKIKKQKRLMNESIKVIHAKYVYEFPQHSMHYSSFCKLKPFWVVKATIADLNTCLCKKCQNMDLLHRRAVAEKFLQGTLKDTVNSIVCSTENQKCMYGECEECSSNSIKFQTHGGRHQINYEQWVTKSKEYGDGQKTKVTVKESFTSTIDDFCQKYEQDMKPRYSTHCFNIFHQYRELKKLRENLTEKEVVVHIDFSENYGCKYSEEIQSVHFGGSHQQASIHTGVYYVKGATHSFSTISECTRHDPSGIWGHLEPVLKSIKVKHPLVNIVHFVSDGPTTQYRNKTNFWLASTIPRTLGFTDVYWNFLEAGHGKGAPDGIGGVLKRTADTLVAQGKDIPSADKLYEALIPATTVELFYIKKEAINRFDTEIPELKPIDGTMKIHQVLFPTATGAVKHRILSCYCTTSTCFKTHDGSLLRNSKEARAPLADITQSNKIPKILGSKIQPVNPQNAQVDKWCVVKYEKQPYPGIITDVDTDSVEVKTMTRVGKNRFYWPMKEDRLWYFWDNVLTYIPICEKVTNRHHQIDPETWKELEENDNQYGLEL